MRHSRYVCLLGLSLFCLITILTFKTPQKVISALANPLDGDSPQVTIEHFWKLMDLRQTDLARELLIVSENSLDEKEFKKWETKLNKNPMLSLQKVQFTNQKIDPSHPVIVRVYWTSSLGDAQFATFSINLIQVETRWRIQGLKLIKDFSSSE